MEWHAAAPPPSDEELKAYVGPNADGYVASFERFRRAGETRFAFSWNWMACLWGVWWYLYRKMYLWAAIDFAVSVLFGWTLFVPILWSMARAATGDYLYFRQAVRKIRELRPPPGVGAPAADVEHLARLAREGGVHRWILWAAIAGTILLLILAFLFFGLLWKAFPPLHDVVPSIPGRWT
ncbi:MAG: hypothetical protein ACM3L8_08940 [Verrucomicrobiota bacterium]